MLKKLSFSKIFFWVGVISLLLIYIILWAQMITKSSDRTGTDFIIFWTAGRIAQTQNIDQIYNTELQREIESELVGFYIETNKILPFNHPLHSLPFLSVLVSENYIASFILWALLDTGIYGISFLILGKFYPKKKNQVSHLGKILVGLSLFFPLFISILLGQDTAILFLGAILLLIGTLSKRDFLAGVGLAITTIRPHISLALALPFIFKRQNIFKYFFLTSSAMVIISFLLLGSKGVQDFIHILLISATQKGYGVKPETMLNSSGLLIRLFPLLGTNTVRLITWGAYIVSIIILSINWRQTDKIRAPHLGLAILFSVFFAPHLNYHDLTLLVIPIFLVLISGKLPVSQENLSLVPLAISFILTFTRPISFLYYSFPYLLMLSLIIFMQRESKTHKNTDSFPNA